MIFCDAATNTYNADIDNDQAEGDVADDGGGGDVSDDSDSVVCLTEVAGFDRQISSRREDVFELRSAGRRKKVHREISSLVSRLQCLRCGDMRKEI